MLENILTLKYKSKAFGYLVTDVLIIAALYFLPTLSHLTSIPFYLFEPMRLAIVFCIINTNQKNSLLLALTVPMISVLLSSHPDFAKGILITVELTINVILFYVISKRMYNKFIVMLVSILIAKLIYYSVKFYFIHFGLVSGDLISTPLWIQYIMMFFFSFYAVIAFKKNQKS